MLAKSGKSGFKRRPLAMTSLIDVIFLLLLFFMLTSTFSKYAEVELLSAGAGAGGAQASEQQQKALLRLGPDTLDLNTEPQTLDTLAQAFEKPNDDQAEQVVIVILKDEVSSQRLIDLLAVLHGIQGLTVHVLEAKTDAS